MNLKDWQKIAEDDKTVTMKHAKGHTMVMALKALPKIQREQMKRLKLAAGGKVPSPSQESAPQSPQPIKKNELDSVGGISGAFSNAAKELGLSHAKGGKVQHFEDGGQAEDAQTPHVSADDQAPSDQQSSDTTHNGSPIVINVGQPGATAPTTQAQPTPPAQPPVVSPAAKFAETPNNVEVPEVPDGRNNLNPNGTMNPSAVAENTQTGLKAQSNIDAAKAKADAAIEGQNIQAQAETAQRLQAAQNDVKQHADQFAAYASNPANMNPKHYQESMSSGQKVTSAIGLFLGGLGTPFGGHNYAMDFLNKQIDRDIDAQKNRMDQQKNIFGAYHQLYGDSLATYNATKATMFDIYQGKLRQAAASLGTPQAQANYLKASTQLAVERSKALQDAAVDLATLPGTRANKPNTLPGSQGAQSSPQGQGHGASSSWNESGEERTDRVLNSAAQKKYDWAMSKYNHVQSDTEKAQIIKEYQDAFQTDKALAQIDHLYPELMKKRTYGGYLADKVNPDIIGGAAAAGAEALGAAGAIPTAGASLIGAIPGAIAAGGAGKLLGHGLQQGLRAVGGQTQTQYETAGNSLESIVASALPGLTPTERGGIANEFKPTIMDTEATAQDKLKKLKQKLVSLTKTPTLNSAKMTKGAK